MLRKILARAFRRTVKPASPPAFRANGEQDAAPGEKRDFADDLAQYVDAAACNELGQRLSRAGRKARARASFERSLEIDPDFVPARFNLANLYFGVNRLDEAAQQYAAILARDKDNSDALNNMGMVLLQCGQPMEAIARLRAALKLRPDLEEARNNLLLALTVAPGIGQEDLLLEHRRLPMSVQREMLRRSHDYLNSAEPDRRLRIGYVSADFKQHPVAFFIAPLLEHHRASEVEIFCYSNWHRSDATTERLKQHTVNWRQIDGMDDDEAVALIREDKIDILVDLSGRTSGARLGILARKPAPLQITYLGYPNTTGLDTVDYRITDGYADPAGTSEPFYVEALLRLPGCMWCYAPRAGMPEVAGLPCGSGVGITFGSCNNALKLNSGLIELWARVLKAVPRSRMLIACLPEGHTREQLLAWFGAQGVDETRIAMRGRLPAAKYWRLHDEVDIALDAYPCNGGATTFDSLWMGVPVVSLCGSRFVSRAGYSILANAGLGHLVANDADQYVQIAASLAADTTRLAALRGNLRNQLAASSLCDAPAFAANVEALYRGAWRAWCERAGR